MSDTQDIREMKKTIRSMIRHRFSVAADRAIANELERFEDARTAGEDYVLDVEAVLDGIGDKNKRVAGVAIDETQSLPW